MSDCGCHPPVSENDPRQRRTLGVALALNAAMAVIGGIAGWIAYSTGLLADALDMASDAIAYAIGLAAIGRSAEFKRNAARVSGICLLVLGIGLLIEVVRRAFGGEEPTSWLMIAAATLSLAVNLYVLKILSPYRSGEVHLRATWIFTRADVVANVGVIAAALIVMWTQSRIPDLIIGGAIGLYVVKEAWEIIREAGEDDK